MDEPKRIISLLSSATEIIFGIGGQSRLAAVSHECDYPPAASQLPRATRSLIDSSRESQQIDEQVAQRSAEGLPLYELDPELIRRLRPGLIVTQAQCDVCAIRYADVIDLVQGDSDLASTEVLAISPSSLRDVLDDVTRIGQAAGLQHGAAAFRQSLERRIDAIASRTRGLSDAARPRVACIEWTEPLMLAANWTPELIELAGGRPGLAQPNQHSTYALWSDLVAYDPEVLLISPCGFDLTRSLREAALLQSRPGWSELSAVRSGRTWVIDGNAYLNRSGPRLVDSLEIVAHLIQPQLFDRPAWSDPKSLPWTRLEA